jgi:hypothetical protein
MSKTARAERFKAPLDCQDDCKEIIVKELTGDDEIAAAVAADQKVGQPGFKADSFAAIMKLERQERVRQSIVAVDGKLVPPTKPINMERFGSRTKAWIGRCFGKLNDPDEEMVKKSLAEAEPVDLGQLTSGEAATDEPTGG